MKLLKRNSLLSALFIVAFLFISLMPSAALAANGSGGGKNPPLLQSSCLATINNNVSTAGDQLGENMALTANPPTIRLEFATNIADQTVWNNNKDYVTLYDRNHSVVPASVSRIDTNVNFAERNYIFVTPAAALNPGSYTIIVDARLTSKNGISAGKEQSVAFSLAGATGNNTNTGNTNNNNDTGSNINTGNNNADSSIILNDISGHWAKDSINKLVAAGVIKGYPDGTFKPDNTVTRAEFVTMIVRAFKLEPKTGQVFNDTSQHWARDYIATAAGYGIINGYNSVKFGPDDQVTREQMAVILDKAIKLKNIAGEKSFADQTQISAWAKDAVIRAYQNGIFKGYTDNTFRPKANASRAEAVTVILNAINTKQ